jgi:hypothetical protein
MNVSRAVDRNIAAHKPIDFWSLKLPKETQAYVPKLLAMRRLVAEKSDTQRDAMLERFDVQGTALRSDIDRQMTSQREVIETRLLAMDKATELLAATVGRVPSDTDKQVNALRELLGARIDGMDRATKLLAETVDHIPTDTDRAVDAARAIIEAQLRNVQDTSLEKFLAIDGTFASNALALTAALAAQKEAAAEQNKSNTLAITKFYPGMSLDPANPELAALVCKLNPRHGGCAVGA